jgi:ABC-2 type transport system ATP-binding protein
MPVLDIRSLTKRYRNGTLANDGIDLAVEPGQVYGLLGPNGAGKTTLVRQVLGLLKPTSGTITLDGVDVVANPGYARRAIGSLPQSQLNMAGIRLGEWVSGVAQLYGVSASEARARTTALVERLQLEPFANTAMMAASGGVRRLAGFAAAIVADPRIIVLDEPTNDVDPVRRQLLWQLIGELGDRGTTVLLVTHNLAEAERYLHQLAIIDRGRILRQGTPAQLRVMLSDRLHLHLTLAAPIDPHPALHADPAAVGSYAFERADLGLVVAWLESQRDMGAISDFRIGPPTLDDIYATALNGVEEVPV